MATILVIDDEQEVRELIVDFLTLEKYEVIEADNGENGINLALIHNPDLIICDINMPTINGYEVLSEIRSHQITEITPFIFLTAKTEKSDQRKGMNLGADDYITKPFTPEELLTAINIRLKKQESIKKLLEKESNLLIYDTLTQLPNRLSLRELFQDIINQWKQQQEKINSNKDTLLETSVHILPIFYLKIIRCEEIYDSLGDKLGDVFLQGIAQRLKNFVSNRGIVACLDIDEFVIIGESVKQKQLAGDFADSLLKIISQPFPINNKNILITANIGISFYPRDGQEFGELINNCKKAVKKSDKLGGNQYHFYSPILHTKTNIELELEADLYYALERKEFELYYQPIIDFKTRKIVGAEALLRWYHPEKQYISPAVFIPIAEETGLIEPIGEWVLKTACQQIKTLQNKGFSDLFIAVNLSARQFNKLDLYPFIVNILRKSQLSGKYLELEITESIVIDNPSLAITKLNTLKSLGIKISMDDFGTGYSSLSYLQKFPFDTLKIDQCFVRDIDKNKSNQAITKAIIEMSHALNLKVVGEGIENLQEFEILKANFCDYFQGFLISPPLPLSKFEAFLNSYNKR